jgi:hypothetical protein
MPPGRPRNDARHLHAATAALMSAVSSLVERIGAMGVGGSGVAQPKGAAGPKRAGKRGANPKLVSVWASYTPKQRAARIAAMRAGHAKRKRALANQGAARAAGKVETKAAPAKGSAPAARKVVKRSTAPKPAPARKSAWASMTPEQRAERVAKMRAGRKSEPVAAAT